MQAGRWIQTVINDNPGSPEHQQRQSRLETEVIMKEDITTAHRLQ
jgi:hypothetical protein